MAEGSFNECGFCRGNDLRNLWSQHVSLTPNSSIEVNNSLGSGIISFHSRPNSEHYLLELIRTTENTNVARLAVFQIQLNFALCSKDVSHFCVCLGPPISGKTNVSHSSSVVQFAAKWNTLRSFLNLEDKAITRPIGFNEKTISFQFETHWLLTRGKHRVS